MTPEDIAGYIDNLRGRFAELETAMADPGLYARTAECRQVTQEHRKLESLFNRFDAWTGALNELAENREMLTVEEDADLRELIESDIAVLEEKAARLESEIQLSLLPPDPNDGGTLPRLRALCGKAGVEARNPRPERHRPRRNQERLLFPLGG